MRYLALLFFIILLVSCAKDDSQYVYDCYGGGCVNNGDTNNNTVIDDNNEEDVEEIDLSGYYEMPFGGFFELIKLNDGRYWIYQQQIFSQNYDGGIAYHPSMSVGPHVLQANGTIRYAQNHNYSDATHDIEKDGSSSNVTGVRRTEYVLRFNAESRFEYEVTIREDTALIGDIHVHRIITEE